VLDTYFRPAKYILLTGRNTLFPNNAAMVSAARSDANKDGTLVKVIVGSQVASEGIDLRFVREIHVFDDWFHLNKMEQVLGRGVRTCSHALQIRRSATQLFICS
jgi:N-acetylneuraminic acid mutarotase